MARVRSQKTGEHERRRSDTGPVINEESNFQVDDLTSVGRGSLALSCYSMRKEGTLKKVAGEEGGGWRW